MLRGARHAHFAQVAGAPLTVHDWAQHRTAPGLQPPLAHVTAQLSPRQTTSLLHASAPSQVMLEVDAFASTLAVQARAPRQVMVHVLAGPHFTDSQASLSMQAMSQATPSGHRTFAFMHVPPVPQRIAHTSPSHVPPAAMQLSPHVADAPVSSVGAPASSAGEPGPGSTGRRSGASTHAPSASPTPTSARANLTPSF